jgi:hypothetical protein
MRIFPTAKLELLRYGEFEPRKSRLFEWCGVWGLGSLGPGRLVVSLIGQLGYLPTESLAASFRILMLPSRRSTLRIGTSLEQS